MNRGRELGVELGGRRRLSGIERPRYPHATVFATLRARARPNREKLCRGRFSRPAAPLDPRGGPLFRRLPRRQSGLKVTFQPNPDIALRPYQYGTARGPPLLRLCLALQRLTKRVFRVAGRRTHSLTGTKITEKHTQEKHYEVVDVAASSSPSSSSAGAGAGASTTGSAGTSFHAPSSKTCQTFGF